MEYVGRSAHRHRQQPRFLPRRGGDHVLDRDGLRGLDTPKWILGEPWVRRAVIAHHQRGRDSLMALAPHRRPDRQDLADDGLGRKASSGNDGRDVIDLDTAGHPITPYTGAALVVALSAPPARPLCLSSGLESVPLETSWAPYTHRSGRPNPTGVKRSPHRNATRRFVSKVETRESPPPVHRPHTSTRTSDRA